MNKLQQAINETIALYQDGKLQPEEFCDGIREALEEYESTPITGKIE